MRSKLAISAPVVASMPGAATIVSAPTQPAPVGSGEEHKGPRAIRGPCALSIPRRRDRRDQHAQSYFDVESFDSSAIASCTVVMNWAGKMMVEFFSTEISAMVCKVRS